MANGSEDEVPQNTTQLTRIVSQGGDFAGPPTCGRLEGWTLFAGSTLGVGAVALTTLCTFW